MDSDRVTTVKCVFAALNRDDVEAVLDLIDEDIVFRPLAVTAVEGREYRGHDGVRDWDRERRATWQLEVEAQRYETIGERLLVNGTVTVRGHLSNAQVATPVCWVFGFRDGRIASIDAFVDARAAREMALGD